MLAIGIEFAIRLSLVALFLPFSALDKIFNFQGAVAQAAEAVSVRSAAVGLILAGLGVEITMSAAILTGFADRFAALILAGYCGATAILWKQFWKPGDFALAGASRGRDLFWDFMKNLALAGGFLILAFGPNAAGVRGFIEHPLASSHPYASVP